MIALPYYCEHLFVRQEGILKMYIPSVAKSSHQKGNYF